MLGNPFPFSWKTRDRAKQSKWVRGRRQRKRIVNVFDVQVRDVIKVNPKEDDAKLQEKKKRVKEILWRRKDQDWRWEKTGREDETSIIIIVLFLFDHDNCSLFSFPGPAVTMNDCERIFVFVQTSIQERDVWRVIRQRRKPRKKKNQANSTNNNDKREETNKRSEKTKNKQTSRMTGEKTHPTLPEGMGLRSRVTYPLRSWWWLFASFKGFLVAFFLLIQLYTFSVNVTQSIVVKGQGCLLLKKTQVDFCILLSSKGWFKIHFRVF